MKSLTNLMTSTSPFIIGAFATLLSLSSCQKSDDVQPSASQNSATQSAQLASPGLNPSKVVYHAPDYTGVAAKPTTASGTITEGINAQNGVLFLLKGAGGSDYLLHSSSIDLGQYLLIPVQVQGRMVTNKQPNYMEVSSIQTL